MPPRPRFLLDAFFLAVPGGPDWEFVDGLGLFRLIFLSSIGEKLLFVHALKMSTKYQRHGKDKQDCRSFREKD